MAKKLRCSYCSKKIGYGIAYYQADSSNVQYHMECLSICFITTAQGIKEGLYSEIHDNFQRKINYSI